MYQRIFYIVVGLFIAFFIFFFIRGNFVSEGTITTSDNYEIDLPRFDSSIISTIINSPHNHKIFLDFYEGMPESEYNQLLEFYFYKLVLLREINVRGVSRDPFHPIDSTISVNCHPNQLETPIKSICSGFIYIPIENKKQSIGLIGNLLGYFNSSNCLDSISIQIVNLFTPSIDFTLEELIDFEVDILAWTKNQSDNLNYLLTLYTNKYGNFSFDKIKISEELNIYRWFTDTKLVKLEAEYYSLNTLTEQIKEHKNNDYKAPKRTKIDVKIVYMTKVMASKSKSINSKNKIDKENSDQQKFLELKKAALDKI